MILNARKIARNLLEKNPKERFSASKALKQKWLREKMSFFSKSKRIFSRKLTTNFK